MTFEQAKELAEKYKQEIKYHDKKYYEDDDPEIEDSEYDMLVKALEDLENEFPELLSNDSPTLYVGGRASLKFSSVNHAVKMESLHDSFSVDEIISFDKRVKNSIDNPHYIVEPKIDGLSVSVEYENGVLIRASTRGDGTVGEDITENILTIQDLPQKLNQDIPFMEVRGEVYISKQNFANLVKAQELSGEKSFKNPRNAAAGSLRQKNAEITAKRNLQILVFNIQRIEGKTITSHKESIDFMKELGFPVPPFYNLYDNIKDVINEINRIGEIKSSLPFQTDGAVVKINSFEHRKILGSTSKFPRWAEAFKYPPEEKYTTLLDIEINVGRTGILTPTGILAPVSISGTTVGRVVLHNKDFINEKRLSVGDTVAIRKAGEIIPEVVKVISHSEKSRVFEFPTHCPSCGSEVIQEEGEVAIRCVNTDCPAQLLRNLIHFVSRDAMDIEGMGEALIVNLVDNKIVSSAADFYELTSGSLEKLERMGQKSSQNILNAIEESKKRGLAKLLFALGIRNVGQKAAKLLAQKFLNIDNIINASQEEIENIPGLGSTIAKSLIGYFSIEKNMLLISRLKNHGIDMTFKNTLQNNKFRNKVFVLTGTLDNYTRGEVTETIEKFGGTVSSSVSKNTSYVLAGNNPGSKSEKATKLGVAVISEKEFEIMISENSK